MLSQVLHKHLDGLEEIEARAQEEIDLIISQIDKKALVNDPVGTMHAVVEEIKKALEEKFIPMAASDGFNLLKLLDKYDAQGKEILIDDSNDPTVNA